MKTSALIFDLDGLLIDSEPIWQRVEVDRLDARDLFSALMSAAQLHAGKPDPQICRVTHPPESR